jgi:aspartyl-tRNA(Asn)/glutamyl-tRNA(Gln) amidotransferase subunit C
MTERITTDDVTKVARLAKLELSNEELEVFTGQLAGILAHADDIAALDLTDVEPMARPVPLVNVFRADVPGEPLDRNEVMASAPAPEDGQFRVPQILGDEA